MDDLRAVYFDVDRSFTDYTYLSREERYRVKVAHNSSACTIQICFVAIIVSLQCGICLRVFTLVQLCRVTRVLSPYRIAHSRTGLPEPHRKLRLAVCVTFLYKTVAEPVVLSGKGLSHSLRRSSIQILATRSVPCLHVLRGYFVKVPFAIVSLCAGN